MRLLMKISVVTTSHWEGDPRLNRHVRYLRAAGFEGELVVTTSQSKLRSLLRGIGRIVRSDPEVILLPDPELFVFGSLAARLSGKRPVIDIHEDYPKTAAERPWIPGVLRPAVALFATLVMVLGRLLAWRVIVAAPQLARGGDILVLNIPDPGDFSVDDTPRLQQVVYVGEVFPARGTMEMVRLLAHLPEDVRLLVIGNVSPETRGEMLALVEELEVAERLELTGRLPHSESWDLASGSLAGLALLQPAPAYIGAVATKLWEYMAAGIPPVVSNLPGQAGVVEKIHPDLVCSTPEKAAEVITRLAQDPAFRDEVVARGRALVEEEWERTRPDQALQEAVAP